MFSNNSLALQHSKTAEKWRRLADKDNRDLQDLIEEHGISGLDSTSVTNRLMSISNSLAYANYYMSQAHFYRAD